MQSGDAVGALGQPQAHVRHVEQAGVVLGAKCEHAADRYVGQQAVVAEVVLDQVHREAVDAGGYRGVGGEHRAGPDRGECLVEVQVGAGDELVDAFKAEEAGVALVGVEDSGARMPGQLAEAADRAHAADAGQDLLADAVVLVAAVEPVGDAA